MTDSRPPELTLAEEVLLLALRDDTGAFLGSAMLPQALGGALLAELLVAGRLRTAAGRRPLVEVRDRRPLGEEVLDECLERVAGARRRARAGAWVSRFGHLPGLKHRVARGLCRKGVLREHEDRVLGLFRRRRYPELDQKPERRLLARLRAALAAGAGPPAPRTAVLIALADATGLLRANLPRAELRSAKGRIERIAAGEVAGAATREAVEAARAAILVACLVPSIAAATVTT
ncbi:MAG: GPP34 family phosphoprotein [Planctomycetota bacterium]|nr:MAG: GPP34 family phosphoprotein [Planctomycetota bacterium]